MKKIPAKIVSLILLSLLVAALLSSCFGGKSDEEVIKNAIEAMEKIKSAEAEMTMNIGIGMGGSAISVKLSGNIISFTDPAKAKIVMNTSVMGESIETESYSVEENGKVTVYTKMFDVWTAEEMDVSQYLSSSSNMSTTDQMNFYLNNAENFTKDKEEKIKDYNTIKFDGFISGDSLKETLDMSGIMDMVGELGVDSGIADSLIGNLDDLKISFWIDADSYNVVKYSMDMKDMMDKIIREALSEDFEDMPDMEMTECLVEIVMFNFNGAPDFEIPAEALNAAAY